MEKKLIKSLIFLVVGILILGCSIEDERKINGQDDPPLRTKSATAVLEMSYDISTYQYYQYDVEKLTLTELDLAHLNPGEEKQHVEMTLLPDGQVNSVVENLDFDRSIKIPHQTLPSDIPGIKRTETIGSIANFYDVQGKLVGSEKADMPKQSRLVERVKELGARFTGEELAKALETMQGDLFAYNVEKMIAEAQASGGVIQHDEQFLTLRTKFSAIEPGATGSSVLLINKKINKLVASVVYDEKEKLTHRMFFGYQKEGVPMIDVVRKEQLVLLPSGQEVWQITCSKLENIRFNINAPKQ